MFLETPRFPDSISFYSQGGPGFSTTVIILNSGYEQRTINWTNSRNGYDISNAMRTFDKAGDTTTYSKA